MVVNPPTAPKDWSPENKVLEATLPIADWIAAAADPAATPEEVNPAAVIMVPVAEYKFCQYLHV